MSALVADPRMHPRFADWLGLGRARRDIFQDSEVVFTYDGQAALFQLFRALRGTLPADGRVLVPAFHCPTVVEPILRAGFPVDFYDVDLKLRGPQRPWTELVMPAHAVVVVINFFGFEFDLAGVAASRPEARPVVIEDCCHSFLAGRGDALAGGRGDYSVYSFKKVVPCLTGGAVVKHSAALPMPAPGATVPRGIELAHLRRVLKDSLVHGGWSGAVLSALMPPAVEHKVSGPVSVPPLDQVYPFRPALAAARMPALARRILRHCDLEGIAARRVALFARITRALASISDALPQPCAEQVDRGCPWGFPALVDNRSAHDYKLRNRGVPFFTFGEQLHPEVAPTLERYPNARRLSQSLLFLPVHQQLEDQQVEEFCRRVVEYVSEQNR